MSPNILTLAGHQMQRFAGPMRLRTESGLLWITVDGQPEDILLAAGECQRFEPGARLIVYALGGDARYEMSQGAANGAVNGSVAVRGWTDRLAAWLRQARPALGGSA